MKVMDLGDCSASVKKRFSSKVSKLNRKGYEELMRINDGGEKVHIPMKIRKRCYSRIISCLLRKR